jgi:hypothetical protein
MNSVLEELPMTCHPELRGILLDHLQRAWTRISPGIDGLTVDDVLDFYSQAAAAGQVPNKEELLRQYPQLATELEAFFTLIQLSAEPVASGQVIAASLAQVSVELTGTD